MTFCQRISFALLVFCPAAVAAGEVAGQKVNGYIAPVHVVDDHPQCSKPGETALELALIAYDMQFRLDGVHRHDVTFAGGVWPLPPTEQRCYITERAGAEVTRAEIPCGDRQPPAGTAAAMHNRVMELNFTGFVTLCQSLTGMRILESDWIAIFTDEGETSIYEGDFVGSIEAYCNAKDKRAEPVVALTFGQSGLVGGGWDVTQGGDSAYQIHLRSLPVNKDRDEDTAITLSTDASFYASFDGQVSCHNEICGLRDHGNSWRESPIELDYRLCQ